MKHGLVTILLALSLLIPFIPQDRVLAAAEGYVNVEEGDYTIRLYTNSTLALTADGIDNCSNVSLETYNGTDDQIWTVEQQTNGTYKIINYESGKVLDVSGPGTYVPSDGTNVQIYESNNCPTEFWEFEQVDDGYRIICTSLSNNVCLDIQGQYNEMNAGCNVQTWSYTTDDNWCTQVFSLRKVLDSSTCSSTNMACGNWEDAEYEEFPCALYFTAAKDNAPVRETPYKDGAVIERNNIGDIFLIDGIVRNEKGNVWLHLKHSDGWIFVDNVIYLFEENADYFYNNIDSGNFVSDAVEFAKTVYEDSGADIRSSLDPGNRGIEYKTLIGDTLLTATAEQLGNMNYGYLGRLVGFSSDVLNKAAGADNIVSTGYNTIKNILNGKPDAIFSVGQLLYECSVSSCDHVDDFTEESLGYYIPEIYYD